MSIEDDYEACDDAVDEAVANTLLLINAWVNGDIAFRSGEVTVERQHEAFSYIIALVGKELFSLLEDFPEMKEAVYAKHDVNASKLAAMIEQNIQKRPEENL